MPDILNIRVVARGQQFADAAAGFDYFARSLSLDWAGAGKVLHQEMAEYLNEVAQFIAQKNSTPWPSGTTADSVSRRTGQMVDSIIRSVQVNGKTIEAVEGFIGGNAIAALQEKGGVIRPTRTKYLTIPLSAVRMANGTTRSVTARNWKNTFVQTSKAGNLIIFQKRGTSIVPLYLLKPMVRIPPRLGMERELETTFPYFLERALDTIAAAIIVPLGDAR